MAQKWVFIRVVRGGRVRYEDHQDSPLVMKLLNEAARRSGSKIEVEHRYTKIH